MSLTPERPYVPHRTPTRAQPAVSFADFTLAKPFVPGAEQVSGASFETAAVAANNEQQVALPVESDLPTVEPFVESPRASVSSRSMDVLETESDQDLEELPPLEHFLDPLPAISDFVTIEAESYAENAEVTDIIANNAEFSADVVKEPETTAVDTDWVETDWQRYDWQSVAALGDTEKAQAEASNDWATTDWEIPTPRKDERSATPADAIAKALDQIADRLRHSDFLPGGSVPADPATIAATLAALLGVRR